MKRIILLSFFFAASCFAFELPSALKDNSAYQEAFGAYYSKLISNLDHRSKTASEYKIKYCKQGLVEACGDVGVEYSLGFSLPKNDKKAKEFIKFASLNSKLQSQRKAYEIALQIANSLSGKSSFQMKKIIREEAFSKREECLYRGQECALSLAYFYILPYDEFGFSSENEMIFDMRKIYSSDKSGFLLDLSAEILLYARIFNIGF